ncbi:hypothetical protein E4U35_004456 [Claviceps purpurea]|nr:hypothetical protein E4U35_004456 [Claviceps purpurea]KAG6266273.1 hypothetical protein E4U48_005590 [Claviceps purpurea]
MALRWIVHVKKHNPEYNLNKLRHMKFHGRPHATPGKNEILHASAALRREDNFKGTGFSLHFYPNGLVTASKSGLQDVMVSAATVGELGPDSKWNDLNYVAEWIANNEVERLAKLERESRGASGEQS